MNWQITDDSGFVLKKGVFNNVDLPVGGNTALGMIELPMVTNVAKKLTITVGLSDTAYKNSWQVWVYPKKPTITADYITITSSFEEAATALEKGGKVLLTPDYKTLEGIEGRFVPVFWSPVHFPNQPASMGLLIDENHPAFESFPTSSHTDWQWWDLCIQSKSVIIDSLDVTPLVRVIDNFVTNHHLANVFEAKVGTGTLVFSAIDLSSKLDERPVARQLRHSIINYMKSEQFKPSKTITISELEKLRLKTD